MNQNPKLWVICGMCGSGDVTAKAVRDLDDYGDEGFKDGVVFECSNCSTNFSAEEINGRD